MYLKWKEITAPDLSDTTLTNLYTEGFVLTRKGRGEMDQTRSVRIDLNKFILSSENRRVLKKTEGLELEVVTLPYADYSWEIGKLGKDFYEDKFGVGTFSANKIKELLTDKEKSNFNKLFLYNFENKQVGYSIVYENSEILHYSYPFYDRATEISNLGLGMMLRAILHAQESGKKYIYLGSAQRPTDIYKLQFAGLEWFDGEKWQTESEGLKNILTDKNLNDSNKLTKKKIGGTRQIISTFLMTLATSLFLLYIGSIVYFIGQSYYAGLTFEPQGKGPASDEIFVCSNWKRSYSCDFSDVLTQAPISGIIISAVGVMYFPLGSAITFFLIFYFYYKKELKKTREILEQEKSIISESLFASIITTFLLTVLICWKLSFRLKSGEIFAAVIIFLILLSILYFFIFRHTKKRPGSTLIHSLRRGKK